MTTDREPDSLGSIVGRLPAKRVSGTISQPSMPSLQTSREEFVGAMAVLCALKRTAEFQPTELKAWHAVLGTFKPATINRAVLLVVADQQRFPEVSDLWQQCRRIEKRQHPYNPHGGDVSRSLTEAEIREIAERIGLEV